MRTLGWRQLVCIQLGGVISLPLVMVGFTVGHMAPGIYGMALCVLGNALLALFGLAGAPQIIARRCATSQNVESFLGPFGKRAMALLMAGSMLLWFAMQTQVVVNGLLATGRFLGYVIFGVCSALSLSNIYSIERYAKLVAPIMALLLLGAVFHEGGSPIGGGDFTSCGGAFAVVIGGSILAIIDLPTFFKEASDIDAIKKAVLATFCAAIPLVECCGVFLAGKSNDLFSVLSGSLFGIGVPCLIVLSGWMTNITNLYSAAKSIELVCFEGKRAYLIAAALGITLTFFPLVEHFADVITFLGLGACSFGGLLLAESCLKEKMPSRMVCWGCLIFGIGVALYDAFFQNAFLGIALVDVFFSSLFTVVAAGFFGRRRIHEVT